MVIFHSYVMLVYQRVKDTQERQTGAWKALKLLRRTFEKQGAKPNWWPAKGAETYAERCPKQALSSWKTDKHQTTELKTLGANPKYLVVAPEVQDFQADRVTEGMIRAWRQNLQLKTKEGIPRYLATCLGVMIWVDSFKQVNSTGALPRLCDI